MGLFRKKKSNDGNLFAMHLLMKEKCELPKKEEMIRIFEKHLGKIDCFHYDKDSVGFTCCDYFTDAKKSKKSFSPQLLIVGCSKIKKPLMSQLQESQLWNCANGKQILDECQYEYVATDMLSALLDLKERADLLVKYSEALAETFTSCRALVFGNSMKMFSREDILNCDIDEDIRFINYAVNVRSFNIEGSEDKLVDSVGMNVLSLPDVQYHFHSLDPQSVVSHAYNVLSYILEYDNPIKDGDVIDGIKDKAMSSEVQWQVHYEKSLVKPDRILIDVNMNEYASGKRNYR